MELEHKVLATQAVENLIAPGMTTFCLMSTRLKRLPIYDYWRNGSIGYIKP